MSDEVAKKNIAISSLTVIQARTVALAGIFQAAKLTQDLATKGLNHPEALETSLTSILSLQAQDVEKIYGNLKGLQIGIDNLIETFSRIKKTIPHDITRYSFSLMHLERKLMNDREMSDKIHASVIRARKQTEHFPITHHNVIANLANIYTDTLSTFKFRIYITGEPLYLNSIPTLNKIRALLLSGVRAAVLWRHLGGKRWQLIFTRQSIVETAASIKLGEA